MRILTQWMMYAEYEDGYTSYFGGDNEELCMCKIIKAEEIHGDCTYYTSITNEFYSDGQLIV